MAGPLRIGLPEMIAWQETDVDRIDAWDRIRRAEGKCLDPMMERRRMVARKTADTLALVGEFEVEFVAMVKARRKAQGLVAATEAQEKADRLSSPTSPPAPSAK